MYFKYKQSNLLDRQGLQNLLKISETEDVTEEIFNFLEIKKITSFGQFLSIIPLLLENYTKIMQKLA